MKLSQKVVVSIKNFKSRFNSSSIFRSTMIGKFSLVCIFFLSIFLGWSLSFHMLSARSRLRHLSMLKANKYLLASSLVTNSLMTPIGDIGAAADAVFRSGGQAALCVLDGRKADDLHDSCQLLPDVVRWRAGHLLTFRQAWGTSKSTGAAIWNGANMVTKFISFGILNLLVDHLRPFFF